MVKTHGTSMMLLSFVNNLDITRNVSISHGSFCLTKPVHKHVQQSIITLYASYCSVLSNEDLQ